jgi:hypothetical protein
MPVAASAEQKGRSEGDIGLRGGRDRDDAVDNHHDDEAKHGIGGAAREADRPVFWVVLRTAMMPSVMTTGASIMTRVSFTTVAISPEWAPS